MNRTGAKHTGVRDSIEALLIKLNRSKFASSGNRSQSTTAAKEALRIFKLIVDRDPHATLEHMLARVTKVGQALSRAPNFRVLLANVTRRVLFIVRESAALAEVDTPSRATGSQSSGDLSDTDDVPLSPLSKPLSMGSTDAAFGMQQRESTTEMLDNHSFFGSGAAAHASAAAAPMTPPTDVALRRHASHFDLDKAEQMHAPADINPTQFRDVLLRSIDEFIEECESMVENMCELAPSHIDENETIMTFGCSFSMLQFFTRAAEDKPFRVLALEAEPHGHTHRLKEKLAPFPNVSVEVIPDSRCFALMARVSKVFLSTDAVLANGGLLAPTGSLMLSLAAKHFSVPIVVVTATLKICPYFPSDSLGTSVVKISKSHALEAQWTTFSQPSAVLATEDVHEVQVDEAVAQVFNPVLEYVPPEFVALFVTNEGELTTTVIHRYLKDQYHEDDTHI